jgi:N4-gp56 family major capsid protein
VNTYAELNPAAQAYYDKQLLKRLQPNLVFAKYGQKRPIPRKAGATVNYRRYTRLPVSTIPIVEGVTPAALPIASESVTAVVEEHGDWTPLYDFIDMAGIDPTMEEYTNVLGDLAGEKIDTIIRDKIKVGTNIYRVNGRATRVTIAAGDIMNGATMRRIRRIMSRNNVRPVAGAGAYLAFVHPDVADDIMGDSAWVNAKHYADPKAVIAGEIGELYGVRYIVSTMAPIFAGEGAGAIDVYGTLVIGEGAYAIPDIAGSSKPQTIVQPIGSGGAEDPLKQRGSVGFKTFLTAARLDELCILRVESSVSA